MHAPFQISALISANKVNFCPRGGGGGLNPIMTVIYSLKVSVNVSTFSLLLWSYKPLILFFTDPFYPTLQITTLEFGNEHILPTGYNVTIVCTSNSSQESWLEHYYGQPFWIQRFFNDKLIGDCGGGSGKVDSEDSKVCTYVIQNATERNSGNYTCISRNQLGCTVAKVYLEFQGTQTNFGLLFTSANFPLLFYLYTFFVYFPP